MKGLAAFSIGALVVVAIVQSSLIRQQGATLEQLRHDLDAVRVATPPLFAMQEKCAQQARTTFDRQAFKGFSHKFENHYNPTLQKCFVDIIAMTQNGSTVCTSRFLMDAYEGKEYGNYAWCTKEGKHFSEIPPMVCYFINSQGAKESCGSEAEFDVAAKRLMDK